MEGLVRELNFRKGIAKELAAQLRKAMNTMKKQEQIITKLNEELSKTQNHQECTPPDYPDGPDAYTFVPGRCVAVNKKQRPSNRIATLVITKGDVAQALTYVRDTKKVKNFTSEAVHSFSLAMRPNARKAKTDLISRISDAIKKRHIAEAHVPDVTMEACQLVLTIANTTMAIS